MKQTSARRMKAISFTSIIRKLERFDLPVFDLVVGIGTGGVVPAALVAAKLGCDVRTVRFAYRDEDNKPAYSKPIRRSLLRLSKGSKRILLVDDVSVTGKTLREAKASLKGGRVKTMVFKGKADFVLLPDMHDCIRWPWKISAKSIT